MAKQAQADELARQGTTHCALIPGNGTMEIHIAPAFLLFRRNT